MKLIVLLVSTCSPLTGPAVTLSVTSLLSAVSGMAKPLMVTVADLARLDDGDGALLLEGVAAGDGERGGDRDVVLGHRALVLHLADEAEVGGRRHVVGRCPSRA